MKHAETFRYVADYGSDPVELSDARELVEQAETFVAAMRAEMMSKNSNGNGKSAGSGTPQKP